MLFDCNQCDTHIIYLIANYNIVIEILKNILIKIIESNYDIQKLTQLYMIKICYM